MDLSALVRTSRLSAEQRDQPEVQAALLQRAALLNVTTSRTNPLSAGVFMFLLWPHAGHAGLVLWFLVVNVTNLWVMFVTHKISQCHDADEIAGLGTHFACALGTAGAGWGLLAIVGVPEDPRWQGTLALMMLGVLASNVIFSSSYARSFWAFQIGAGLLTVIGFGRIGGAWGIGVSLFFLYAIPYSGVLAHIGRGVDEEAAHYAARSRQLVDMLQNANADLQHQSLHDALTGLPNRTAFLQVVERELHAVSETDDHVGVLYLDLDRFKMVNDSLGHSAGDDLLREVVERVQHRLRPDDYLARAGGDELTVLLRRVPNAKVVEQVAFRLLDCFAEPFTIAGRTFEVTASIGAATTGGEPYSATDLLRVADAALYQAKDAGRANVVLFDESLRARIDGMIDEKAAIERAMIDGKIEGWFQPLISLETGEICGAEGLARWIQPDGSPRPAFEFMPLVDELGLGSQLSLAVARDLRALLHACDSCGSPSSSMRLELGVNVEPWAIADLMHVFDGQDLSGIVIEITERGLFRDLDLAKELLGQARDRGAAIALDDFGTGYSALSLITDLPLDSIKIDRHFVATMETSAASRAIIAAVTEIGRSLDLEIVAEGIETQQQAAILRDFGVTYGQGFLFSPALPAADFADLVKRRHNYRAEIGLAA